MIKKKIQLDGKTWLQNSISIWSDIRKTIYEKSLKHPAMFPVMLPKRLISIFSTEDDLVFDPFAGIGSTLIAAKESKRYSLGIELSKEYINSYKQREDLNTLFADGKYEPKMIQDNAINLLKHCSNSEVQLTITSPPYWDILNRKRTADYKKNHSYSNSSVDIGNIENYNEFLDSLISIFKKVFKATKSGGYCCINMMDIRKKNKLYLLHIDTINFMKKIGFTFDDLIIWDRRHEYNNLRPLGYPYVFRINRIHEYILIFQKL